MSRDDPSGGGGGGGGGAEKADRHLRQALDDAAPEDELRAIVTVKGATASGGAAEGGARGEPPPPPHPKDFRDRVGYRQAMIEHDGRIPRARVGAAKEALQKLGLTTLGEGHAGLLIVQGPARSVAGVLELEVVERVALDRQVEPRAADGEPPDAELEAEAEGQEALGPPPGDHGPEDR